jgi:hypothetical protein
MSTTPQDRGNRPAPEASGTSAGSEAPQTAGAVARHTRQEDGDSAAVDPASAAEPGTAEAAVRLKLLAPLYHLLLEHNHPHES